MTREEAILILEEEAEFLYGGDEPYNKIAFDMAIEALSAEQNEYVHIELYRDLYTKYQELKHKSKLDGDLISREDAVKAIYDSVAEVNSIGMAESVLREVPSAEAGWIPCSERLPERDEIVLVSYKTMDMVHVCKYLDDGSENPWWSYIDDCLAWNNVVLAWMPLPKPYTKGEKE